jgi:hypothetical protein
MNHIFFNGLTALNHAFLLTRDMINSINILSNLKFAIYTNMLKSLEKFKA